MTELTHAEIESLRHPGGGSSRVDRNSADSAQAVIDSYFEDESGRQFVYRAVSQLFEILDEQSPKLGSVTLFNNRININAGRILVGSVRAAVLVVVDEDAVADDVLDALRPQIRVIDFKSVGRCLGVYVLPEKAHLWDSLVPGIRRVVERAYADRSKTLWPKSHSPGVVDLLAEKTGLEIDDAWQRREAHSATSTETIMRRFIEFLRDDDPATYAEREADFESLLTDFRERFGPGAWQDMSLRDYALGTDDSKGSFCYFMEFGSTGLGGIGGGSSTKHLIYYRSTDEWYFPPQYDSVEAAWEAVREGFLKLVRYGEAGEWEKIDDIPELDGANVLRTKYAACLYPEELLPVLSESHLRVLHERLGTEEDNDKDAGPAKLNRRLYEILREYPELDGYSNNQLVVGLYRFADPRPTENYVKIAPGANAELWEECLRDGNIRVGWDAVGNLQDFEYKAEFREAFADAYPDFDKSKLTKKGNEVWTLRKLRPGDLVFANQGISEILAVGKVVEPGYVYLEEYPEYRHAVTVEWDTDYAQPIEPQKYWGLTTVADVEPVLATLILSKRGEGDGVVIREPFFEAIESALTGKKQVVLFGPPGTGKTHHARRFAMWWLGNHDHKLRRALSDPSYFSEFERDFAGKSDGTRAWIVVANPLKQDWHWGLLEEGPQKFYEGQLSRNFPQVQKGDLVFGYEAGKAKRLVALCRIAKAFGVQPGDDMPTLELELLSTVENGLTYHELKADPQLAQSEAIRCGLRGTLFKVTEEEAAHLQEALTDRDVSLTEYFQASSGTQQITRVTFHPSYSYEDFVEGYRPVESSGDGLKLRLEDGVFKRICREAAIYPDRKFLLLIDELNRGNVAKVFGELITLLEADKRGMPIRLPQSKETLSIPENVYILATMNTADRSLRHLDAALRRRFRFIEMMPDYRVLQGATVRNLPLDDFLRELNRQVIAFEGREKQIGHSYLLEDGEPVRSVERFAERFRTEILPLLQEYCFDDYDQLAMLFGKKLVDTEIQEFDQMILDDPELLLDILEEQFIRTAAE